MREVLLKESIRDLKTTRDFLECIMKNISEKNTTYNIARKIIKDVNGVISKLEKTKKEK